MLLQTRNAKVFVAALISITIGTLVLKALRSDIPSAAAFCLSDYYRLDPIENVIHSHTPQSRNRWNRIEIYYSATKAGDAQQLLSTSAPVDPRDIKCHFFVNNGLGGGDGQIRSTEKWQRQSSITPERASCESGQTIRICIITSAQIATPTAFQIKRTETLAEGLSRKFDIRPAAIHYPEDW